ncbi:MAG: TIGR03435 family protein [Bryobacteraceae bacterium]|jgi:uncharacterized protein (TIGR03435 family)
MRRAILAVTILQVVLPVVLCLGQTPARPPAFEVASVKVSKAPPGSDSSKGTLGSLTMRNMTLRACIGMAYNLKEFQVLGGPKWLDSDRYDIDAKPAGAAQALERMAMLQTLLAERFQLALHRETKTSPGYALVVSKAGLKMHAVEPGQSNLSTHNSSMTAEKASMASLAGNLSRRSGFPVDDATGVKGVFDFKLELPPRDNRTEPAGGDTPGAGASDPASFATSLSHALEDQLGLKLDARKIQQEVLVIDRAEKPPEN